MSTFFDTFSNLALEIFATSSGSLFIFITNLKKIEIDNKFQVMLVDNMIYRISISRSLYTNDGFKEPPDEDN